MSYLSVCVAKYSSWNFFQILTNANDDVGLWVPIPTYIIKKK